jgi:hypothetical protein
MVVYTILALENRIAPFTRKIAPLLYYTRARENTFSWRKGEEESSKKIYFCRCLGDKAFSSAMHFPGLRFLPLETKQIIDRPA